MGLAVGIVGLPNVGKSTLINHMIGEKVSITSKKPQTTRDRVLGVVTEHDAQIVFMDTPGFQTKVGNQLIRRMNRTVRSTLGEVDAVVFVIEALGWRPADLEVLSHCTPVYEELPGWQCETSKVTDYAALPENANAYVNRILDLVGGKLGVLSDGPARETTLRIGI